MKSLRKMIFYNNIESIISVAHFLAAIEVSTDSIESERSGSLNYILIKFGERFKLL